MNDPPALGGFALAVFDGLAGDANLSSAVDVVDLLAVLAAWGPCPRPCLPPCAADVDGDCTVGIGDLLVVLGNWS